MNGVEFQCTYNNNRSMDLLIELIRTLYRIDIHINHMTFNNIHEYALRRGYVNESV